MGPRTSCWRSCGFGPWPLLGPLSSGALLPAGGRHKGVGSRTPCSPQTHSGSGPAGQVDVDEPLIHPLQGVLLEVPVGLVVATMRLCGKVHMYLLCP